MEKLLLFIKHNFVFLWNLIEKINNYLFSKLYRSKLDNILPSVFKEFAMPPFTYRRLNIIDAESLHNLIRMQELSDLKYFNPHGFDIVSIKKQLRNPSFLMMGTFDKHQIVGYFFLRFFANKKCFVGRLIDKKYRGKGIGLVMNNIMYKIAWCMGFRCLSTISRNNKAVMQAHAKNPRMIVLKDLHDDYLLVEFIRETKDSDSNCK